MAGKPLYLLDENISYKFVIPFKALGYDMTSIQEAFAGRKSVEDPEIIEWIGQQQTKYKLTGVWITDDWDAHKSHAKTILAQSISVLWICDPRNHSLKSIQQLQVLAGLIEPSDEIFKNVTSPKYLKGTIDGTKIRLWQLASHLMAPKLAWEKVLF